ncbi:MAG: N-acetylmuramoyl-L-alanine amidase [Candidatus Obscuribacterales bacterium]|nr:N-acetylmuramoyl-L-alanine amidase [Candidatus Obscuribacterales bacterium]
MSSSPEVSNNSLRLNTQQFILSPITQYFPGPQGQTIMTMDFPGIVWDKPSQLIHPPNSEIESIRIGQFQCDPIIFRISITAFNPAILKKISVETQGGSLYLRFPPAATKNGTLIPLSAQKDEYLSAGSSSSIAYTKTNSPAINTGGGLFWDTQGRQFPLVQTAPAVAHGLAPKPRTYGGKLPVQAPPPMANNQTPFAAPHNFPQQHPLVGGYNGQPYVIGQAPVPGPNIARSGGTLTAPQMMPNYPPPPPQYRPQYQPQSASGSTGGGSSPWLAALGIPFVAAGATAAFLGRSTVAGTNKLVSLPSGNSTPPAAPPVSSAAAPPPSAAPVTTPVFSAPAVVSGGQIYPSNNPPTSSGNNNIYYVANNPGKQSSSLGPILGAAALGTGAGLIAAGTWPRGKSTTPNAPTGIAQNMPPQAPTIPAQLPINNNGTSGLANLPNLTPLPVGQSAPGALLAAGQLMGPSNGNEPGLLGGLHNKEPFVSIIGKEPQEVIVRFNPNYSTYRAFRLEDPPRYVIDVNNGPTEWDIEQTDLETSSRLSSVRIGKPEAEGNITRVVLDLAQNKLSINESFDRSNGWLHLTFGTAALPRPNTTTAAGKVVVLDAGHGGSDPGAQRGSVQEKELTLAITKKLERYLQSRGMKTIMTRNDDTFISLEERVRITNSSAPDAFVSVHINSLETNSAIQGIETYYQTEQSRPLADKIHQSLVSELGVPNRSVRKARFYVVNHTPIPAVLAEVGFISNKDERNKLISSDYQERIAEAIGQGVMLYLAVKPVQAAIPGNEVPASSYKPEMQSIKSVKSTSLIWTAPPPTKIITPPPSQIPTAPSISKKPKKRFAWLRNIY